MITPKLYQSANISVIPLNPNYLNFFSGAIYSGLLVNCTYFIQLIILNSLKSFRHKNPFSSTAIVSGVKFPCGILCECKYIRPHNICDEYSKTRFSVNLFPYAAFKASPKVPPLQ